MYLICCMTLLAHLKVMQIYGWELFTVCQHGMSCKHRHCDDGDTVFFICHVTSREHVQSSVNLWVETPHGESPPFHVCRPLVDNASGDMNYLIRHVNSQNHVTEGSFEWELFMVCHHLAKFGGDRYCGSRDVFSFSSDKSRPCD